MAERNVVVRLSAETSGAIASMTRFGAVTKKVMGESAVATNKHNKILGALGTTAKYGTLAVAGGLALAAKEAADFNEKMALVRTLSHANAAQMQRLTASAKTTGAAYGYTAGQVADGQAEMVKAGVSLKDIMGGGLKGALTLAAAGQTDVANATEIAAAAMTQFRLKGKDIPHIADLLAAGADKALGSVTDLGYGLSQVGTTAHQPGLSIEQTTGTLAAFAQAGLIGEKGGTTFKQMLLKLEKPSKAAQDIMDQYSFSLYKANGQIKTMPELAANLQSSFQHLTPAARNFALGQIFGTRAIQGANIMMAEGAKGIASWIRKVNDQGFAAHQASGKLNSLKGDLQKLKAEGVNALIDLGQGAQSPLRHLVQDVTGDLRKITTDGSLKKWGNETAEVLSTVGSALKTVGGVVGDVAHAFNSLPEPIKKGIAVGGISALALSKVPGVGAATKGVVGGLTGGRGVVPVFVTNEGFGGGAGGNSSVDKMRRYNQVGRDAPAVVPAVGASRFAAFAQSGFDTLGWAATIKGFDLLDKHVLHTTLSTQGLSTELQTLGTTGKVTGGLGKSMDSLASSTKTAQTESSGLLGVLGKFSIDKLIPGQDSGQRQIKSVKDLDKALAGLEHRNPGVGIRAYDQILHKAGISADQAAKAFPRATHALQALNNSADPGPGVSQIGHSLLGGLKGFGNALDKLDKKNAHPKVTLNGSQAKRQALDLDLNLTKLDRTNAKPKTTLQDHATSGVRALNGLLGVTNAKNAKPKVTAIDHASGTINGIRGGLASLHDKSITITTTHNSVFTHHGGAGAQGAQAADAAGRADGGPILGHSPNNRADNILIAATAGEHMLSVDEVNAVGGQSAVYRMRSMIRNGQMRGFADGGAIGASVAQTGGGSMSFPDGMRLEGRMQLTGLNEGYFRGIARSEAQGVVDDSRDFDNVLAGRNT